MIIEIRDLYLPLILATFLAYIAYQQMRISHNKLKLDLYNKRFEVYSNTIKFQQELISDKLTSETHRKFIEVKQSSFFLFNSKDKIYESIDKIHEQAIIIIGFKDHGSQLKGTPEFKKMFDKQAKASAYIKNEVELLHIKFSKYLTFNK